jgi:hypothetical protein
MALTDARWRALEPLIEACRVVSDVEPVFETTHALRGLRAAVTEGVNHNTLMSRRVPGGSLKVVA